MQELSQAQPRARRPWTVKEQLIAEVAAACGVSCAGIGRALNRGWKSVQTRISKSAAEKLRNAGRRHYELNREKVLLRCRLYYHSNIDLARQRNRNYRQANLDKERQRSHRYYESHREEILEKNRVWDTVNPASRQKIAQNYRDRNREKEKERTRRYRMSNPQYKERQRKQKKSFYWANVEKMREIARCRRASNPSKYREIDRRRKHFRRSRRRLAVLPATTASVKARFAIWNHRCGFCGVSACHPRNFGYNLLTEEHVLPLSRHGLDEASNIMPACATCNCSRQDKPVESWYRAQSFFTEARWRKIQRHCPAAVMGQLPLALAG